MRVRCKDLWFVRWKIESILEKIPKNSAIMLFIKYITRQFTVVTISKVSFVNYTQYPIIRNDHIRNTSEIWGNFKKRLVKDSNLRTHWNS